VSVSEQAPEGYSGRSFGDEESMIVGFTVTEEREVQIQRPRHLLLVAQAAQQLMINLNKGVVKVKLLDNLML
jgi:hypothetical protein